MKDFNKLTQKERSRISTKIRKASPWSICLNSISQRLAKKHKNYKNKKIVTKYTGWNDYLVIAYRGLVVKNVGYSLWNNGKTFENTILKWHNRLRGKLNERGLKQERTRGKELSQEERKWRYRLEKEYSKFLYKRDNTGWKKLIYYSYSYILKAEKKKLGTIRREKTYCKTWQERLSNVCENINRRHERKTDGWVRMIDLNHSYLLNREKIRLGVLNHG